MNCRRAQALISRALDRELPSEDGERLGKHAARCATCAALHGEMRAQERLLGEAIGRLVPSGAMASGVLGRISWRGIYLPDRAGAGLAWALFGAGLVFVAATTTFLGGIGNWSMTPPPPPQLAAQLVGCMGFLLLGSLLAAMAERIVLVENRILGRGAAISGFEVAFLRSAGVILVLLGSWEYFFWTASQGA